MKEKLVNTGSEPNTLEAKGVEANHMAINMAHFHSL